MYFLEYQPLISLHKTTKYASVRCQVELWKDIQATSVKLAWIWEAMLPSYPRACLELTFTISQERYIRRTKCHFNAIEIPQTLVNSE